MSTGFVDEQATTVTVRQSKAKRFRRPSPLDGRERPDRATLVRSRAAGFRGPAVAIASPIYRNAVEQDRTAGLHPAIEHAVRQRDRHGARFLLLDQRSE